jgi:hypothetical protein
MRIKKQRKMNKTGSICFSPFINEIGQYIGEIRMNNNTQNREQNPRFDRGDKGKEADIMGVKGELIFSCYLSSLGIGHTVTPLFGAGSKALHDLEVGSFKMDVKTIKPEAWHLLVNRENHDKKRNLDYYVFIRLINSGRADYFIYSFSDVCSWEFKKFGYTEAYFKPIKEVYETLLHPAYQGGKDPKSHSR